MVRAGSTRRSGFTLIELIVVVMVIAIVAGLTIAFLNGFNSSSTSSRGASDVQGSLSIARSEALRSRRPYGVRLISRTITDPTNPTATLTVATELQFIEQPDDFFGGRVTTTVNGTSISLPDVDLYGGLGNSDPTLWPVQPGDYIELKASGQVMRIVSVDSSNSLTVASPVPCTIPLANKQPDGTAPNQYRIIRAPRPVGGEPMALPSDIIIDLGTNSAFANTYGGQLPMDPVTRNIDILFGPGGGLVGRGTSEQPIYLWVRNVNDQLRQGDETIVVVFATTGMNAASDVPPSGDPYLYARDGRTSGK
jgi:type IV fimbrial biogenesis protein FimT